MTYWASGNEATVYEATARLIVGPGIESANPDLNALRAGGQLIQTYAELPETGPFLEEINEELDLGLGVGRLDSRIRVSANEETQILTIDVQSEEPEEAVSIANAVADKLVAISPSAQAGSAIVWRQQMEQQAAKIEQDIINLENSLAQLETELNATFDFDNKRLILDRIGDQSSRLSDANRTLAGIYADLGETVTNQVKIIEPATVAKALPSQLPLRLLISVVTSFIASLVLLLAIEYWLDTVESVTDLQQLSDVPVLETPPAWTPKTRDCSLLISNVLRREKVAESYRKMLTRLLLNDETAEMQSFVVTAPSSGEIVFDVVFGLAAAMSQKSEDILVIDANMHDSPLAWLLESESYTYSMTDVLSKPALLNERIGQYCSHNLHILPIGSVTDNSFGLLTSDQLVEVLQQFKAHYRYILILTPPVLDYAETIYLASKADGVILPVVSRHSRRKDIREAIDMLRAVNAKVVGTVMRKRMKRPLQWGKPSSPIQSQTVHAIEMEPTVQKATR